MVWLLISHSLLILALLMLSSLIASRSPYHLSARPTLFQFQLDPIDWCKQTLCRGLHLHIWCARVPLCAEPCVYSCPCKWKMAGGGGADGSGGTVHMSDCSTRNLFSLVHCLQYTFLPLWFSTSVWNQLCGNLLLGQVCGVGKGSSWQIHKYTFQGLTCGL